MDLSTKYLGLDLKTPLMAAASPLSQDTDKVRQLEDAGASAIVFHSLFEEQINAESRELHEHLTQGTESFAEALSFFPEPDEFVMGPEEYLKHIADGKAAVNIPIIGSLNGCTNGGWVSYAKSIEQAGADALELNIYSIPTDMNRTGEQVESGYIDIVKAIKSTVNIPVAVKLSPFFSNFTNMAKRLDDAGADGLVLFNRFYQPDIELESLEVAPNLLLSTPMAMRLPLTWIAILHGRLKASLAATRGIYRGTDAIKMLMVGADVTMLCSVLLRRGIGELKVIEDDMVKWMEEHEYVSVSQMKGSLSQKNSPDPSAFVRAQYTRVISSYSRGDLRTDSSTD